jgi:hypothetical protein
MRGELTFLIFLSAVAGKATSDLPNPEDPSNYGVDVSYPIHHYIKEKVGYLS